MKVKFTAQLYDNHTGDIFQDVRYIIVDDHTDISREVAKFCNEYESYGLIIVKTQTHFMFVSLSFSKIHGFIYQLFCFILVSQSRKEETPPKEASLV